VKVEREAQEMADSLGVKIFQADIIYHLFDKFTAFREELKQKKREEFRSIAVFPCKLKVSKELQTDKGFLFIINIYNKFPQCFNDLYCKGIKASVLLNIINLFILNVTTIET